MLASWYLILTLITPNGVIIKEVPFKDEQSCMAAQELWQQEEKDLNLFYSHKAMCAKSGY